MPDTTTSDLRSDRTEALGRDLSRWLQAATALISAEIRSYPTPIPRCDAQFNHLIAQRDQVARIQLELESALESGDRAALRRAAERFASLPPFGEAADEQSLRARIGAQLDRA